MSAYRPYPKYKESGVEWLGEVPEEWVVAPFKWQIDRNDGGVWGDDPDGTFDTIVLRSTEQTVDGHWKMEDPAPRKLTPTEINSALLIEHDLLVTKSSGSSLHIGKTTLVTSEIEELRCCYSNFMQRIRMKKSFDPKLAWHVMNNDLARLQFDLLSNSSTGLANLNGTMIGQIMMPVAPLPEQRQIASFLDRECGKLDALQAKQERLIELLKEKRQALISHAVTRGLDPTAKLKPSGIEWLGEVPVHWRVAGFTKFIVSKVDYRGRTPEKTDSGVFLVTARNIKNGRIDYDASQEYITEESYLEIMLRGKPEIGDVLFTTEAPLGEVAEVDRTDVGLAQRIIKFRGHPAHLRNDYLKYFILSSAFQQGLYSYASGSTALGIKAERFVYLRQLLPPLAEQRAIVAHLDEKCGKIDQLKAKAERAIALLKERRSALISAAVTGKIDVRTV